MRIAVIGPLEFPGRQGGMSRHIEEVYARLAARGHETTVLCRRALAGSPYRGMEVRTVPTLPGSPLDRFSYSAVASVLAATARADVVHYHSYSNSGWCFVPRLCATEVAMTVHRLEWLDEKWGPVGRAVLRSNAWVTHRSARAFIAVSRDFEDYLLRHVPPGRSVVRIPNGVTMPDDVRDDAPSELGLEPDGYLLAVSRLVPEKGLDVLLDALARVANDGTPLPMPLVVAGQARNPTPYSDALTRRADTAPSPVRLLGVQPAPVVHGLYRGARALVAPSRREGNPLTVIEGMAHGCCVIASDIPPHRELLGDAGLLVPVDDAGALADALRSVTRDPGLARDLGARARARIDASDEYQWDGVASRTEAVLAAVASGERPPVD
ncbi:MAG: phosphatidyl-myo-inositol mannosyltransferase [Acidimicrobiia bacterium]